MIEFKITDNPNTKKLMTDSILHSLPEWFGIESAIQMYIKEVQDESKSFLAAYENKNPVGFISLKNNYSDTTDIFLMAVLTEYHRRGIGKELVDWSKKYCFENNKKLLIVKTVSERRPDLYYSKTRLFYKSQGFFEIEENLEMWGEGNPCLMLGYIIGKNL